MTYNYYFDDEITKETVNDLIERIQDKEQINLWFSTSGGDMEAMSYLISVFNSFAERITITLCGQVHSAGLELLTDYTGKLVISDRVDYFIFHKEDREMLNLTGDHDKKMLLKCLEEDNKIFAKKLKQKEILTDKQIKEFDKGKDVYVYREQIKNWKL